jgi:transposase
MKAEIALLKNGHDSTTSSTSPSHDTGRSNQHSLRVKSEKKTGGQPGHPGHALIMKEQADEIIEHNPCCCSACGESLDSVTGEILIRRQEVDLPPVQARYVEHQSIVKTCPLCGLLNRGALPEHLKAPVQYGSSVKSLVGYMSVFQYLPYKRMSRFFSDIFHLPLSEGSIDNILEEMRQKASAAYETIHTRISGSEVVGADETGCHVNGKKSWFHVWQNTLLTFIVSFKSRGHQVIEEYFKGSFIYYVSDCWASQLKTRAKAHQLCIAHLLRELLNFEKAVGSKWCIDMKELFYRALELKKNLTGEEYKNPPPTVLAIKEELNRLLKVDTTGFHIKLQALINRLVKNSDSILTFLSHPEVPPDNNGSERAIRNVKVKTKVSGQFRSIEGAERFAVLRSIIDTTNKNGRDVYTALRCVADCFIK